MDPITMSIAALVATMVGTRKNVGSFGNMFSFGNTFSSLPNDKDVEERFSKKMIVQAASSLPVASTPVTRSTNTSSDASKEPSAPCEQKKVAKPVKKATKKKQTTPEVDEKFVMAVVEKVKVELPSLIEQLNNTPSQQIVSETYDNIYRSQIASAQEFLNENRSADLSRVKCLLHKLLPKEYFEYVEQLREHQDPQTIINIMGGQNMVAPNAKEVKQTFSRRNAPKKQS